jgi:hypothetical protein
MDVIRFEAGPGAASAEDRETMLATVAGSGKDHPTLGLIEPAHRVLRMTAMDDAPDEADDPLSGQRPRTGLEPRRVHDPEPEAMGDVAEVGCDPPHRAEHSPVLGAGDLRPTVA